MNKEEIIKNVDKLINMHKKGLLGGEKMPEDANPNLDKNSLENYIYFTLPMALNYQRNSYKLWESAKNTFEDANTNFVFVPKEVLKKDINKLQEALVKYKIALQKNKQTEIWMKLCETIEYTLEGDIRNLFKINDYDILKIKSYIQIEHKKDYPYISGNKICNYRLYVLMNYTDIKFKNLEKLNIAPDTHIIKASYKLGVINEDELKTSNVQKIVEERWNNILKDKKYIPIMLHTPMWLWSRNGFINLK